ncbi:MAG: aminotransferase class V-fold PLP-dependent enzyme [Balneolaceae bacterium]|nr:aminotransferase class V-fold PLP-dependent enzyme [Balneolaceae bacterium]
MPEFPLQPAESDRIRQWFPHIQNGHLYLNHAAISPLSTRVTDAIQSFINERQSGPVENLEHSMQIGDETRNLVSDYLNAASPSSITYIGNTSDGISAIAEGLQLKSGDEILVNAMEFPTNVQPYRALASRGIKTKVIETPDYRITASMIERHISPATKVVSLSAVQFLSGYRADIESIGKLCDEKDIWFIVDAIQCLGAFPIDVQKCRIHALASGGHKWLMSPMGLGILYTSPELAEHLTPYKTGWLSVEEPWDLFEYEQEWLPYSQHLETGTPNMLGIVGLGASLKMFQEVGHEIISRNILALTSYLSQELLDMDGVRLISPAEEQNRAGIVSFYMDHIQNTSEWVEELKKEKITISAREGLLRIAPHFYNTKDELDNILDRLNH